MKIVAISGSYRKGKTIETLMEKALEGARAQDGSTEYTMIRLVEKKIDYCRNCYACSHDDPSKPYAQCAIQDDMQEIYPLLAEADAYIFGTPVNMGHVTAVMKTFLERICYVMGTPGTVPIKGCPKPRATRRKRAIILVSSGIVPPILRRFCDEATPLLSEACREYLNAEVTGTLYAGAVQNVGVEPYLKRAYRLGEYLVL
jgi:NAD(P)H-dependent FMN reductase